MFSCDNCGSRFEEPDYIEEDMESFYGVGGLFVNHNYKTFAICPNCGSYDIEESAEGDEEEEEYDVNA